MILGTRLSVAVLFAVLFATGSACTHNIGDSCMVNSDCSALGDRFCDTGSPNGYCTVVGCDYLAGQIYSTCPNNADCVRFFTLLRTPQSKCDPLRQGRSASECKPGDSTCCVFGTAGCCTVSQLCIEDASINLSAPVGYCAEQNSERRYCMAPCNNDGDCRPGYLCYTTFKSGAHPLPNTMRLQPGALPVPYVDTDGGVHRDDERYCAPASVVVDMGI